MLSYSDFLPKWKWMMGTGVYLDNVKTQLLSVQGAIDTHIENTRIIILLVALGSILVMFGIGTWIQMRHKKVADETISALGQKIVTLQEEEQRHISRELHDGIVQVLVSIKYSLEATGKHLAKIAIDKPAPLSKAETNLSNAINEIRRISHHLHPRILDELGLSAAMEAISKEFSERTGIDVTFHKPALSKLLPDHINTTLYRVVQEALMNIEKHAKASKTVIDLSIKDSWLTLTISDDGVGIDSNARSNLEGGIGTRNLAERVQYHKGEFSIISSSHGTQVIAKIPRSEFANYYATQKQDSIKQEGL